MIQNKNQNTVYLVTDLCNTPIADVRKLLSQFFDKEKYVLHY